LSLAARRSTCASATCVNPFDIELAGAPCRRDLLSDMIGLPAARL
jgi:hypothetical protein